MGRLERHLPRGGQARRHPGDVLLAVHRGTLGFGTGRIEDLAAETAAHPFFDDFWASKAAPLSRITVPAYVVASWSDQGLHTRGTFEGFTAIGSAT